MSSSREAAREGSQAAHLSFLAGLAGIPPVGISFPAPLDIEQASEGLAPFLS